MLKEKIGWTNIVFIFLNTFILGTYFEFSYVLFI